MQSLLTLRVFLDSLEEGVLFLDAGRKIHEMNVAAQRMLGQVDDSFLGNLCPSLFAGSACARECEIRGHCSLMRAQDEDRKVQDVILKGPDGADLSLRMWAMLLPPNDSALACAIILRDCSREIALETEVRERWQLGGLIGRSRTMQHLYRRCCARGKRRQRLVTARAASARSWWQGATRQFGASTGPYVAVHCASLPKLLESELFGHSKGPFRRRRHAPGTLRSRHGGTLCWRDRRNIACCPDQCCGAPGARDVRVGENPRASRRPGDAATHRDLPAMVKRGEFREDLYYRLRVLPWRCGAREHREDIRCLPASC